MQLGRFNRRCSQDFGWWGLHQRQNVVRRRFGRPLRRICFHGVGQRALRKAAGPFGNGRFGNTGVWLWEEGVIAFGDDGSNRPVEQHRLPKRQGTARLREGACWRHVGIDRPDDHRTLEKISRRFQSFMVPIHMRSHTIRPKVHRTFSVRGVWRDIWKVRRPIRQHMLGIVGGLLHGDCGKLPMPVAGGNCHSKFVASTENRSAKSSCAIAGGGSATAGPSTKSMFGMTGTLKCRTSPIAAGETAS